MHSPPQIQIDIKKAASSAQNKLNHISIIMDGNSRWAQKLDKDTTYGHIMGAEKAKEIIELAVKLEIKHLSLYSFSVENWNRPAKEVAELFNIFFDYLCSEEESFKKHNIKFHLTGSLENLPENLKQQIEKIIHITKDNTGLNLYILFNYSGKAEILHGCRKIQNSHNIFTEENLKTAMYSSEMPAVDLLIRTGGRKRISNILPWHIAYSEIYFLDIFWPEFREQDLLESIEFYHHQNRTFGARNQ